MTNSRTKSYLDRFYRHVCGWQNGTDLFFEILEENLSEDSTVLELGPGVRSRTGEFLADRVECLDGLDIDEEAARNPSLDLCLVYDGGEFPISSNRYDAVVADYVLEHLENPEDTFREVSRVLKPGGFFIFRTPNLFHYVSLITRMSPYSFHIRVANWARGHGDSAHDPYPTFFRANRRDVLLLMFERVEMRLIDCRMVEKEPSYMQFSRILFLIGVAYERVVNSAPIFEILRANIFGVAIKKQSSGRSNQ